MIVKNESKIILRFLESVFLLIDSYVICDTGSTDNTIEIITTFFEQKRIFGKIIQEPFQNFGYNRTFALNACRDMKGADYILLLDADMTLIRDYTIPVHDFKLSLIDADVFYVLQGNNAFQYNNSRIVKNSLGAFYWGVTHEYLSFTSNAIKKNITKKTLFINDVGDGGSKINKTERDISLLEQGLIDNPDNDRYTFYLANSYRDIHNYEKAIELYKKRIDIGGWNEEIWYSHYTLGKLYKELHKMDEAIFHWLEAFNIIPNRIENIYHIVKYYRERGNNQLAYNFLCMADYARNQNTSRDFVFTEKDVYDYKLDYELTIIGYYYNDKQFDVKRACMKVLSDCDLDDVIGKNVLSNYKFYSSAITDNSIDISEYNIQVLSSIGETFDFFKPEFYSSTPSITFGKTHNELLVCVRFVNYHISETGHYINQKNIITKNVIASIDISKPKWNKTRETILRYDYSIDDYYIGLEDVRILRFESTDHIVSYKYNCNRCNQYNQIKVENGDINILDHETTTSNNCFLSKHDERDCEKNWCLFEHCGKEKCLYTWYPLVIGDITNKTFINTHVFENVPGFFKYVRGSCNGVIIGEELWFLCHVVSYENCRYYYHIIVVLDKNELTLKKYTNLFTFEKQKVEYSLGFIFFKTQQKFLLGYSVLDKQTKFCYVSKHVFDDLMIPHN
jgi:glycosyltransferase involved in cell wall biosynthesis